MGHVLLPKATNDKQLIKFLKEIKECYGCAPSVGYMMELSKKAEKLLKQYE